jgi:hypothetical protein
MNAEEKDLLREFDEFVRQVWPGGMPSESQRFDLRRTFFAGALVLWERLSRPAESEDQALAWCKAVREICIRDTSQAVVENLTRRRNAKSN